MTTEPSERFAWIEAVRQREARAARTRELRQQLAEARAAGKAKRHADRLARQGRTR